MTEEATPIMMKPTTPDELMTYIGQRYDTVTDGFLPEAPFVALTGQPFVEINYCGWFETLKGAVLGAQSAFDLYADGRVGTLYWRREPEFDKDATGHWRFYMRLLISEKEVINADRQS